MTDVVWLMWLISWQFYGRGEVDVAGGVACDGRDMADVAGGVADQLAVLRTW